MREVLVEGLLGLLMSAALGVVLPMSELAPAILQDRAWLTPQRVAVTALHSLATDREPSFSIAQSDLHWHRVLEGTVALPTEISMSYDPSEEIEACRDLVVRRPRFHCPIHHTPK